MIKVFEITRNGEPIGPNESGDIALRAQQNIKQYMSGGIFKAPTGRLRDSIRAYTTGHFIYIVSQLPYANVQNEGRAPHVMWYLLGKTIPIRTPHGVVFRKATMKSFLSGRWMHPGITAKKYVEAGVIMTKEQSPDIEIRQRR